MNTDDNERTLYLRCTRAHQAQVCVGERVEIKRASKPVSGLSGCDSECRGPLRAVQTRDKITDCLFFSICIDPRRRNMAFVLTNGGGRGRRGASLHRAVRVRSQKKQRLVKAAASCSRTLEQRAGLLYEPPQCDEAALGAAE